MKHVTKEAAHETRELKRAVISDLSVAPSRAQGPTSQTVTEFPNEGLPGLNHFRLKYRTRFTPPIAEDLPAGLSLVLACTQEICQTQR